MSETPEELPATIAAVVRDRIRDAMKIKLADPFCMKVANIISTPPLQLWRVEMTGEQIGNVTVEAVMNGRDIVSAYVARGR